MGHYIKVNFRYLTFLFLLLYVTAKSQKFHTFRINPAFAMGAKTSQVFEEVQFLPLESTKESSFGILQKLQISEHYYSFFDYTTKAIFIFNKNGSFHSKISELPFLNNETLHHYSSLSNFILQNSNELIYVVYNEQNKQHTKCLAVFNAEGQLLQSKKMNQAFNEVSSSFGFVSTSKAIFANENENNKSNYYFSIVNNFDSISSEHVQVESNDPFKKCYSNKFILQSYSSEGSLWYRLFDNSVYSFDTKGNLNKYSILLPASLALGNEFYKDSSIIGNRSKCFEYLSDHRDKVSYFTNWCKSNDLFFFSFVKYNSSSPNDSYLYNSASNNLFSVARISPDSLSFNIPIFSLGGMIVGADKDYAYYSIPSFVLYNTIKNSPDKSWQQNTELARYISTQDPKSNPVLIRLKFKKEL